MLERITPLVLTYNEAANIRRTLERLSWAHDIVVVDSFSCDGTLSVIAGFPQARVIQRKFDSHENQWNFALRETGIKSEWVLALDADYILTSELLDEVSALRPPATVNGYQAEFDYCVYGRRLRGSTYPPVVVLYRREKAYYWQDGHTHRLVIDGVVENLRGRMLHDDWKPLSHWLRSQDSYMQLELQKLRATDCDNLSFSDRIRKTRFLAPFFVFIYCLFVKRAILDGRAGLFYALQRMLAETLLSLYLIDDDLLSAREASGQPRGACAPAQVSR